MPEPQPQSATRPRACNPLRVALFYLLLVLSVLIWGVICLLVAPWLPYRTRYYMVAVLWSRFAVDCACRVVGIRYRLTGLENIPAEPCVVAARHQSTWETLFLSALFHPLSQVLKKELLNIPFFGWGLRLLKPIALDRKKRNKALTRLLEQGSRYLEEGSWVLIFPEGTRVPAGQIGRFSRGAAMLSIETSRPLLPIAHNAGQFWPREGWGKRSGTIEVVIGPPLYPHGEGSEAVADLTGRTYQWIAQAQQAMGDLPPSA